MKKTLITFILLFGLSSAQSYAQIEIQTTDITPSTIPSNGVSIPFLNISITPNDQDIGVRSITLQKTGLSDRTEVKSVRATSDFRRSFLGRVDNDDQVRLRFLRPIYIQRGQTEIFEITAHLSSRYGRTVGFELLDIETTEGNPSFNYTQLTSQEPQSQARVSGYRAQELTFHAISGNPGRLRYGRNNRLGRFRIQNPGRKTISLGSISLKNIGTADVGEIFSNITLRTSRGEVVSYAQNVDRKNIGFNFEHFYLRGGENVVLEIWGVFEGGHQGETIQFILDDEDDLRGTVSSGLRTSTQRQNSMTRRTQIDDGPISYGRSRYQSHNTQHLWNRNYNPGTKDIVFLSKNIRHNSPIFIEDELYVLVANGSQVGDKNGNGLKNEQVDFEATFEDFKLYIDGKFHDSADDFEIINGQLAIHFRADIELYNTANFIVTGRISRQAKNGDRLRLQLDLQKSFPEWELIR